MSCRRLGKVSQKRERRREQYECEGEMGKKTSATGFEPVRVTPTDFESVSLTTRTY